MATGNIGMPYNLLTYCLTTCLPNPWGDFGKSVWNNVITQFQHDSDVVSFATHVALTTAWSCAVEWIEAYPSLWQTHNATRSRIEALTSQVVFPWCCTWNTYDRSIVVIDLNSLSFISLSLNLSCFFIPGAMNGTQVSRVTGGDTNYYSYDNGDSHEVVCCRHCYLYYCWWIKVSLMAISNHTLTLRISVLSKLSNVTVLVAPREVIVLLILKLMALREVIVLLILKLVRFTPPDVRLGLRGHGHRIYCRAWTLLCCLSGYTRRTTSTRRLCNRKHSCSFMYALISLQAY